MKTTNIKYGRRKVKYLREDFLKEYKLYKQLILASDPDTEIVLTGYAYLKEQNILDFDQLQKDLKRKPLKIKQELQNKKIPENIFELGKFCLENYGISYKDINNFYLLKDVEELSYKRDFITKIIETEFKEFYENKFYSFDKKIDPEEKIEIGFPKKKYTLKNFFDHFKISYNLMKKYEEENSELLRTAFTGFVYKLEKKSFPFKEIKEGLKRESIIIETEFKDNKIPKEIFDLGKECLSTYGLDYNDIVRFYTYEKLRENSFKRFLKTEVEDKSWINYFLNKNTK